MEELQDFKLDDLYDKLRLEEDEFQEWLSEIGLLHASRTCACGNPMRKNRDERGILHWRCFRAVHRPAAPTIGFQSLLKEFNWRERFGQQNMIFYNFWSQVAALYPCQR
uniref:Uncharacterized protein n=1 Tax=Acrobeloides nanus TaxID=290746 RepID=A0A914DRC1_9BILA